MKTRPKTPHETPIDDGGQLIADLQRQCDSLRTWQNTQATKLNEREKQLDAQTKELEDIRTGLEADQATQNNAHLALQQARETLTAERQQFTVQQEALAAEFTRVEDLQARVELDRTELMTMRADLDSEWTNLCRIRLANEKLASELDAERNRLQKTAGPALTLTKAA